MAFGASERGRGDDLLGNPSTENCMRFPFPIIFVLLALLFSGCVTANLPDRRVAANPPADQGQPPGRTFSDTPYSSRVLNIEGAEPPFGGPAWYPEHVITQEPSVVGRSIAMGQ